MLLRHYCSINLEIVWKKFCFSISHTMDFIVSSNSNELGGFFFVHLIHFSKLLYIKWYFQPATLYPIKVKSFPTEVPCIRIPNQFKNRKAKAKLTQKYCMVNIASSFSGPLQDFPNQFKNRKAKSAKLTQKYWMVNIEQAVFQG